MKKIFVYTLIILAMVSCLSDFEEINTNTLLPTKEQLNADGVAAGAFFVDFQKKIIPTRSSEGEGTDLPNRYQVAINLAGDNWAGYMSPMSNKWNNGVNFTTYYMLDGWIDYAFNTFYGNIVNSWMQIKAQTHTIEKKNGTIIYKKKTLIDQSIFSVAQIIKIMGLHRATDAFGPIPYTEIGKGDFKVAYDSQETIYKSFFEELQTAINTLKEYQELGGEELGALKDFDAVYQGNTSKWIKLANSLMLRLAVRSRYANKELATKWATQATTNHGGLIENLDDIAKLESNGNQTFINSLELLWKNYDDCRIGATLSCYLNGYNDPRKTAYGTKFEKDPKPFTNLKGVRTGIPTSVTPDFYRNYSIPKIYNNTPTYWFKASEVQFLKAEAALYGLITGNAKTLYENGITTSLKENNTSSSTYLNNNFPPNAYEDIKESKYSTAEGPSKVTVRWSDASSKEEQLEKIIIQKYIAIYPDGQEAWTEWRRTGYPKQIPAYTNRTDGIHGNVIDSDGYKYGVRRMIYPRSEYQKNEENTKNAVSLLKSGVDDCNARLWWDANTNLE